MNSSLGHETSKTLLLCNLFCSHSLVPELTLGKPGNNPWLLCGLLRELPLKGMHGTALLPATLPVLIFFSVNSMSGRPKWATGDGLSRWTYEVPQSEYCRDLGAIWNKHFIVVYMPFLGLLAQSIKTGWLETTELYSGGPLPIPCPLHLLHLAVPESYPW